MPNFSSLASLEVAENLWCGGSGGGFQVATVSNPMNLLLSCFELS